MNRTYTTSHYLRLVDKIRSAMPSAALSTDIITGFPTESEDDHRQTLALLERVKYDGIFTFKYSPRENTPSFKMGDDVTDDIKTRRIGEVIDLSKRIAEEINRSQIGGSVEILVEG